MMRSISDGTERMDVDATLTSRVPLERRRMMVFSVRSSGESWANDACMSTDGVIVSSLSDIMAQGEMGDVRVAAWKTRLCCHLKYVLV